MSVRNRRSNKILSGQFYFIIIFITRTSNHVLQKKNAPPQEVIGW